MRHWCCGPRRLAGAALENREIIAPAGALARTKGLLMINVYWLQQDGSDVPADNGWLSPAEAAQLTTMRFAKRRADWRLGRWTAKRAIAAYLKFGGNLRAIELRAASDGAPEAYLSDEPALLSLSLSHSGGTAFCSVAPSGVALGCDLETVEPRSDDFLADYFTAEEQAFIARAPTAERSRLLALLWGAKESALKALRTGLRLDTRSVVASPADALSPVIGEWRLLRVRCTGGSVFDGWWRQDGARVRTLVAAPSPALPVILDIAAVAMLQ